MLREDLKKGEDANVELQNIILKIPKTAIEVRITAKILDDKNETAEVSMQMMFSDILAARNDFLENVEDGDDYDVRYVLTDEGREYLRSLENES